MDCNRSNPVLLKKQVTGAGVRNTLSNFFPLATLLYVAAPHPDHIRGAMGLLLPSNERGLLFG
jgi:hypothetical protein